MPLIEETRIQDAEERLRLAMLASDVGALDELLSPQLLFTTHLGQVVGKADDLDFHRSGLFRLEELSPSEQRVLHRPGFSVVSVLMRLAGTLAGTPFEERIRYTRIWSISAQGRLQVVAGHASSAGAG